MGQSSLAMSKNQPLQSRQACMEECKCLQANITDKREGEVSVVVAELLRLARLGSILADEKAQVKAKVRSLFQFYNQVSQVFCSTLEI